MTGGVNAYKPDGRKAGKADRGVGFLLPCAAGGSLRLAEESGLQYLEAGKRHEDLPKRDTYFAPFMEAAVQTFGCAAPATGRGGYSGTVTRRHRPAAAAASLPSASSLAHG
ncbi:MULTISPECIES: hypothetical protein [unclassified Streptomyces]|uniref:hypothetical protein n=1 Tax=unclassified Streptomyces TaxID=2593676 RepID=UPI00369CF93B